MDKFKYYDSEKITGLNENEIFIFGSNLAGRHGAGAARTAMDKFNAQWGVGEGFTGNCYAIPTKDKNIETLPLIYINQSVAEFLVAALLCDTLEFTVTKIGCGLAGYTDAEIAPMFRLAPKNCLFHRSWREYLE